LTSGKKNGITGPINESSKILEMQHVVGDKEYNFVKKPSVFGLISLNWMSQCCSFQNSMIIYG